jgi:hypothetical protein
MNPPERRHTVLLDGEHRVLQLGAFVAHKILRAIRAGGTSRWRG